MSDEHAGGGLTRCVQIRLALGASIMETTPAVSAPIDGEPRCDRPEENSVMTPTGQVAGSGLGVALPHRHLPSAEVCVRSIPFAMRDPGYDHVVTALGRRSESASVSTHLLPRLLPHDRREALAPPH